MTPEQAQRLRIARDTMPERLITRRLYRENSRRDALNGVCAVGHMCVFADIPLDWFRDSTLPKNDAEGAFREFYGLNEYDTFTISIWNDSADAIHRRSMATEIINQLLTAAGYKP